MRIERKRSSHVPYLTHRELLALRAEALRRLPYQRKWRAVAGPPKRPPPLSFLHAPPTLPPRNNGPAGFQTTFPRRSTRPPPPLPLRAPPTPGHPLVQSS